MKKSSLFLFLFTMPFLSFAQGVDKPEKPETGSPETKYGFFIGSNMVTGVESSQAGITLGAEARRHLNQNFGVALRPSLSLFSYRLHDNPTSIEAAYIELPAYVLFTPLHGSVRPVFSAGPDMKLDAMKYINLLIAMDAGVGLAIDGSLKIGGSREEFVFQPQVTYSYSGPMKAVYFTLNFLDR